MKFLPERSPWTGSSRITVKVLEPDGIGELMLESNMSDQWFQVEESGYIVPFFPGAIFPLTKKIKTKLLLQGVKNERNKQSDPESVPVINIPF